MSAITQIPAFFPTEFGTNWEHLCQQKLSNLRAFVSVDTVNGKEKSYNQIASTAMSKVLVRSGDTVISDVTLAKRWLRPYPYEVANFIDEWDAEYLGSIALPQSDLIQSHAAAYGRTCDSLIVEAALGTAYTGDTGVTPTVLPSGQKIAADYVDSGGPTTSGLTLAKLRQAKYILDNGDVEDSERILVCSAKQINDLLKEDKIGNADYNTVRALAAGEVKQFLGFTFRLVSASLLPYNTGTGVRSCVAYAKSGIKLADGGRKVHVDIRPDKSHSIQIRTVASLGATRMEEAKVVEVACDEVI